MGFAIAGTIWTTATTQGFAYYATAIIINLAIAAILGNLLAPDFNDTRDTEGLKKVLRTNIMPRRIIYGEGVTGGPFVTLETIGSEDNENEFLKYIIVLAGHPVEDILGMVLEDEYINIEGGSAGNASGGPANNLSSDYYVTPVPLGNNYPDNDNYHMIKLVKNCGWGYADNQYVTDKTDAVTNPHSNPVIDRTRASNISNSMGRWFLPSGTTRDADGLYTDASVAGPDVKGKRLYNPYLDADLVTAGADSGGTHDLSDPDTWEWSEDWTLCALDYLLNKAYGIGAKANTDPNNWDDISLNEIDWAGMIQSYLDSSEEIPNGPAEGRYDHGTGPRYTINGVFETGGTPISIMESILTSGGGELVYSQGLYSLMKI